jgi:hypothetical protein
MPATTAPGIERHEYFRPELLKLAVWPAIMLVLSLAIYLWLRPSAGIRALRRSEQALRSARSWHSVKAQRSSDGSWIINGLRDVTCPADYDETILHADSNGSTRRQIEFQGVTYSRSPYGGWLRSYGNLTPVAECGQGPFVGGQLLYSDLNEVERNGEVRRGEIQKVEGGQCQWWSVSPEKGAAPRYSVCLNAVDYLPHDIVFNQAGVSVSFTRWNTTIISLPAEVAPLPQSSLGDRR